MSIYTQSETCSEKPADLDDENLVSSRTIAKFIGLDLGEHQSSHEVAADVLREVIKLYPNYIHKCHGCGKFFYYYDRDRVLGHFGYVREES